MNRRLSLIICLAISLSACKFTKMPDTTNEMRDTTNDLAEISRKMQKTTDHMDKNTSGLKDDSREAFTKQLRDKAKEKMEAENDDFFAKTMLAVEWMRTFEFQHPFEDNTDAHLDDLQFEGMSEFLATARVYRNKFIKFKVAGFKRDPLNLKGTNGEYIENLYAMSMAMHDIEKQEKAERNGRIDEHEIKSILKMILTGLTKLQAQRRGYISEDEFTTVDEVVHKYRKEAKLLLALRVEKMPVSILALVGNPQNIIQYNKGPWTHRFASLDSAPSDQKDAIRILNGLLTVTDTISDLEAMGYTGTLLQVNPTVGGLLKGAFKNMNRTFDYCSGSSCTNETKERLLEFNDLHCRWMKNCN